MTRPVWIVLDFSHAKEPEGKHVEVMLGLMEREGLTGELLCEFAHDVERTSADVPDSFPRQWTFHDFSLYS